MCEINQTATHVPDAVKGPITLKGVGSYGPAREKMTASLAIAQSIGYRAAEAASFFQLRDLAASVGRAQQGPRLVMICQLIDREIGHGDAESDLQAVQDLAGKLGLNVGQVNAMTAEVWREYQNDRGWRC
jgi:hypothetical protein